MKTYKVIFARDEVLVCVETQSGVPGGGETHLEHNAHGSPIYALVHAEDSAEACRVAKQMVASSMGRPKHMGDPSSDSD
ncbi:hypothetical protein [Polluticoccus soli]|uniref:hypothetical protein n=1 Tax=Polluticoccus soli TaxID=3034150 RepID=UPI0023E156E1|nr:hypothetical protein [Flavipsychrobacter sp. JY13-12]